jgi:hypothetical protein
MAPTGMGTTGSPDPPSGGEGGPRASSTSLGSAFGPRSETTESDSGAGTRDDDSPIVTADRRAGSPVHRAVVTGPRQRGATPTGSTGSRLILEAGASGPVGSGAARRRGVGQGRGERSRADTAGVNSTGDFLGSMGLISS